METFSLKVLKYTKKKSDNEYVPVLNKDKLNAEYGRHNGYNKQILGSDYDESDINILKDDRKIYQEEI